MANNGGDPNQPPAGAVLLAAIGDELGREEDTLRNAWAQLRGLYGDNFPSCDQFKVCAKKCKGKEIWVVARDWAAHSTGDKINIEPVHMFATMQCPVRGPNHNTLLSLQIRGDMISRYMSAVAGMGKDDAVVVVGETLLDMQDLNNEVAGTTFEGRVRRWFEIDMDTRWRESFRRQERINKERKALNAKYEEDRKERDRQWNEHRNNKGDRGDASFCHHFLAGNCAYGARCRFKHPANEQEMSRAQYETVRQRVSNLKVEDYGKWWKKSNTTDNSAAAAAAEIRLDLIRKHPLNVAPHLPRADEVSEQTVSEARADLKRRANSVQGRNAEIKAEIDEAIRKPRACEKLGLWENLANDYCKGDASCWEVWKDGLDCIGKCKVPDEWELRDKPDKMCSSVDEFESSKIIKEVMQGVHRKPVWGDALIDRTWNDCIAETNVIPELGYALLEGPFEIDDPEEIRFAFRRFPREQKLNKVRLIDPAVGANMCSPLDRRVPIPSPHEIQVSAAVAHDPSKAGKAIVMHNRKVIKRCRKAEKKYEAQLLEFFKGDRDVIDLDLIKKGAVQPIRGCEVVFNEESQELAKRRKVEQGVLIPLEIVVIDVARCYKNIFVKESHRKYNRLIAWNPAIGRYQWFSALTAIFGSRHSVTGWGRNGKCIRGIKRGHYGINADDYVDDFPSFVKLGLGQCVSEAFLELLEELGLPAMMDKVAVGTELEILGLMFSVVNGAPEVFLTESKKKLIKEMCKNARESGEIELDVLDKLVGRLTFALSAIADGALSPVMRPEDLMAILNEMHPYFFAEVREGFSLGDYGVKTLAGTMPDCIGDIATAYANASGDSDSETGE
eukprot:g18832.t1